MTYSNNVPVLYESVYAVPLKDWRWPNFNPQEIASHGNGQVLIVPTFLDKLQFLRNTVGIPLVLTSWYRDPAYNNAVSTTGTKGPHTTGRAVDIAIFGSAAYNILEHVSPCGFTGVGIKQTGNGRFIHLDDLGPEDGFANRPWLWSY